MLGVDLRHLRVDLRQAPPPADDLGIGLVPHITQADAVVHRDIRFGVHILILPTISPRSLISTAFRPSNDGSARDILELIVERGLPALEGRYGHRSDAPIRRTLQFGCPSGYGVVVILQCAWALAVKLAEFGIDPGVIAALIEQNWAEILPRFHEANKDPGPNARGSVGNHS